MLVYQLRQVFVASGNQCADTRGGGFYREGADDIVRLYIGDAQQRQTHGADDFMDGRNLLSQVRRHRRTVSLILRVDAVAKGVTLGIKHDGDVGPGVRLQQTADHVDHALHRPSGPPLAIHQRRQGMIGAEQIRRAIHQHQFRHEGFRLCRLQCRLCGRACWLCSGNSRLLVRGFFRRRLLRLCLRFRLLFCCGSLFCHVTGSCESADTPDRCLPENTLLAPLGRE